MVGVSSPWGIQPHESSTFQWCVRGRVPGEGAKAAHHHPASVLDTRSEDLSMAHAARLPGETPMLGSQGSRIALGSAQSRDIGQPW